MTHRIIVLGLPGAGKGTQAVRAAAHFGIPTISTGDLFRSNIKEGTELGLLATSYIDAGNLVPDGVTTGMVGDRLASDDTDNGFILDGYPRNLSQAMSLDELLRERPVTKVIEFVVNRDEIIARLHGRAAEQGRSDDTVEVIGHRLDVYAEQTKPLVHFYGERGLLVKVDAIGAVDDVTERVITAIGRG